MPRILFVEDERAYAVGMVDRLTSEGYEVELASNGNDGMERARKGTADLILLDVMLPGRSGLDICRELRASGSKTPVLLLTARGEISDRVAGLKLGADDYLVKPFATAELLARMEALLRRAREGRSEGGGIIRFGDIAFDAAKNELSRGGEVLDLSRAELRLLKYLIAHRGNVVSREELLQSVWGLNGDTLSRTVDVHVAGLRKKIEPDPRYPEYLITVKGAGYRLTL